jgi:chromosome segregation ATPase
MKPTHCLIALTLTLSLIGCGHDDKTAKDVKQDYQQALKTTGDYVSQGKDEFVATMDKKMKELDGKIDELSKKSSGYKDDAKAQADKALAALREQRDVLKKKYDELKGSSKEVWDKTKAGFASAWDDVEKAYENTKSKFQ